MQSRACGEDRLSDRNSVGESQIQCDTYECWVLWVKVKWSACTDATDQKATNTSAPLILLTEGCSISVPCQIFTRISHANLQRGFATFYVHI